MRRKLLSLSVTLMMTILIIACQDPEPVNIEDVILDNMAKITISQGIAGTVIYKEGNFMPPVVPGSGVIYPLSRKVYLYDYAQVFNLPLGHFIEPDSVTSTLLSQIKSDINGFYQFNISDTGIYSIFVKENGKYYNDYMDGSHGVNSFKINRDSVLIYNIFLDYNACY